MKPSNTRSSSTITTISTTSTTSTSPSTSSTSTHQDQPFSSNDDDQDHPIHHPHDHPIATTNSDHNHQQLQQQQQQQHQEQQPLHPTTNPDPFTPTILQLARFIRPSPNIILIVDPSLDVRLASDRAIELLGPISSHHLPSICHTIQSDDDPHSNSIHFKRLFDQARLDLIRFKSHHQLHHPHRSSLPPPPPLPPPLHPQQPITSVLVRHRSLHNIHLSLNLADHQKNTSFTTTTTSLLQIYAFESTQPGSNGDDQQVWFSCQFSTLTSDSNPTMIHNLSNTEKFINRMKHVIFDSIVDWPMHAISADKTISMANPEACKLFQELHLIEEFPDQSHNHHHNHNHHNHQHHYHPPGKLNLSSPQSTGNHFDFSRWKLFDPDFKIPVPIKDFPMERALRGETTTKQQYGCILPDGTRRIITLSAKTIRDSPFRFYPDGSTDDIIGGLLCVSDLTDEFERTKQVEREKELLKAEALAADDANKSKSTFLSNMSHEIRMPIAVIHGLIDLLLDSHLTPQQRDYAETIKASADCLLSVIGDVLDLSKIESGKLTFERAPFDLSQLVSETERLFSYTAKSKSNDFKCHLEIDPRLDRQSKVVGDRGRIRQVLNNLISNALKFTSHGSVKCYTKLEPYLSNVPIDERDGPQDSHNQKLKLTAEVVDTGIGLTTQSLHRLTQFEPFSQADPSTSKLYGGSGLGLCIVKSFVDAMGGQISLESEGLGKGCKATVLMIIDRLDDYQTQSPLKFNLNNYGNSYFPNGLTQHNNNFQDIRPSNHALFPSTTLESRQPNRSHDSSSSILTTTATTPMPPPTIKTKVDRSKYSILIAEDNPIIGQITLNILKKSGFVMLDLVNNGQSALNQVLKKFNVYQPDSSPSFSISTSTSLSPSLSTEERGDVEERVLHLDPQDHDGSSQKLFQYHSTCNNHTTITTTQENKPYDLVLLDLMMPFLDGFETLKAIRQAIPDVYLPVIALSASASRADRERCQEAKFDDFLTKPVKFDELERRVLYFLSLVDEARGQQNTKDLGASKSKLEGEGLRKDSGEIEIPSTSKSSRLNEGLVAPEPMDCSPMNRPDSDALDRRDDDRDLHQDHKEKKDQDLNGDNSPSAPNLTITKSTINFTTPTNPNLTPTTTTTFDISTNLTGIITLTPPTITNVSATEKNNTSTIHSNL